MPHKFKQQHQRRLPHVQEELEGEEQEDEARHGASVSIAKPRGKQPAEPYKGVPSETPAMEAKYGRIESSPLPLRRALLSSVTGQKCGPSTPVPLWKMYDNPLQDVIEPANPNTNPSRGVHSMRSGCPRVSVSARKLAASLWEMQGAPEHQHRKGKEDEISYEGYTEFVSSDQHESKESDRHLKGKEGASPHVNSMASPNHHHQHRHEDKAGSSKHRKLRKGSGKDVQRYSPVTPAPPQVEADTGSTSFVQTSSMDENVVRPGGEDGSALSRELVKVLNQIWSLEEQHNVSTSTVASLRADLKKTKARVQELRTEQSSYQEDMEMLNKKLADEKSMLQDRTQEAILAAIKPLKEELKNERKSNLKLESKHKKLSKEMNEARKTLAKTVQEFEREQKARELMEDVCDELAREIGEDKAQVEELQRQSAKYREEVEQERQMLQMAEVWREERVQMKLAEARLELEEKNDALDKLRGELEAFLRVKRSLDDGNNANVGNNASSYEQATPSALHISDKQSPFKQPNTDVAAPANALLGEKQVSQAVGEVDDDDSFDDDLHSIELNRRSVSGSHEDPIWVHGNGYRQKAMAHSKLSVSDSTHQGLLLSPSAHGMGNGKQGDVNKVSLNRLSSESGTALMAESSTSEIQEVDPHLIGKGFENGVKDWDLGERPEDWSSEGLPSLWQHDREEGRGSMTKVKGKTELAHMDNLLRNGSKGQRVGAPVSSLDLHGNGAVSKLHVFELSRDHNTAALDGDGGLSVLKQSATFPSSPTRQWAHSWSSPDPESSSKVHQALKDRTQVFKDNSLKARLLEAKLEGQQEKLRNSQVH